ncbi:MAG TPA: PEP-CTERM sorting domain-containing protein [Acetobacteraceae bacterium]|nr:PEP-CTERM sorting domain-containing protein [Acetobacteraceae bacterium]
MKRLYCAWPRAVLGSAVVTAVLALNCATASAGLTITDTSAADKKTITDTGGCANGGCIPLGTTGYVVDSTAPSLVAAPGVYKFTYLGAGNSVDDNKFTVAGGGTFCTQAFKGCNGGVQTPIGTSFTVTLTAGEIPFVFTAGPNGPGGCVLTDGSTANALPYGGCADYFVALSNSTANPGLTGPAESSAYIGLTDLPFPCDNDFQDLDVLVQQIPEPATLAVLGFGLMGVLGLRKHRET